MEQALLKKLKDGTADEIDVAMIASRCKAAHDELLDALEEFTDKVEELTEKYEEEYKIGGISLLVGYTDKPSVMAHPDKPVVSIVYGRGTFLKHLANKFQEELKND